MKYLGLTLGGLLVAGALYTPAASRAAADGDLEFQAGYYGGKALIAGLGVVVMTGTVWLDRRGLLEAGPPPGEASAPVVAAVNVGAGYWNAPAASAPIVAKYQPLPGYGERRDAADAIGSDPEEQRRSMDRPPAADSAHDLADLGPLVGSYEPASVIAKRAVGTIVGLLFAGAGVAVFAALAAGGLTPDLSEKPGGLCFFAGLAVFLGLLSFALAFVGGPRKRVALFRNGLALQTPRSLELATWDEIADVTMPWNGRGRTWTIDLADGRKMRFHGGLRNYDHFRHAFVQKVGLPDLAARRVRRIEAGETVRIGAFQVSREALSLGKTLVRWHDIDTAIFQIAPARAQMHLRVNVRGRPFTWSSRNLLEAPSAALLQMVLERVAPPRIWSKRAAALL